MNVIIMNVIKMKKCKKCGIELTPAIVYGGYMGFMCRMLRICNDWETMNYCQKCRNGIEKIINEHSKLKRKLKNNKMNKYW